MDNNTVTIIKSFDCSNEEVEKNTHEYYKKEIKPLFKNIVDVKFTYQYSIEQLFDFLYVPSSYNIHNLGYIQSVDIDDKNAVLIRKPNSLVSSDYIKQVSKISDEINVQRIDSTSMKTNKHTIQFYPFFTAKNENLLISSNDLAIDGKKISRCYFTIECKNISTNALSQITKLSMYTGIINPVFDGTIYPASDYMRFYGLIQPIIHALVYIDIILALGIFFSTSFTQYLNLNNKKNELKLYLLLGLSKKNYFIYLNASNSSHFVSSSILLLCVYSLFMIIFKAVARYSFFFNPLFFLLYFGLMILQIGIQFVFNLILYKNITTIKSIS